MNKTPAHNSVFIAFELMTNLEFLTLLVILLTRDKKAVSNSQKQQIRKPLATIKKNDTA